VVRDLIVDMTVFFKQYNSMNSYLIHDTILPEKERLQSPEVRDELNGQRATLKIARRQLAYLTPRQRIETYRRSLDERQARLTAATQRQITLKRERLAAKSDAVHAASPQAILKRGYAIVTDSNGQTISSAADAPATSTLHIQFADGTRTVTVNP
jgi:exonuclease VII large subunit